jgi:hypothetical protein
LGHQEAIVPDIVGVTRETIRDARQEMDDTRHGCGLGCKMCVYMGDSVLDHFAAEHDTFSEMHETSQAILVAGMSPCNHARQSRDIPERMACEDPGVAKEQKATLYRQQVACVFAEG